jgi:hypothetical protein
MLLLPVIYDEVYKEHLTIFVAKSPEKKIYV